MSGEETCYSQHLSQHYYQGGYQYTFVDDPAKFECPICLLCQRDPQQTVCGHRFCRSCLLTWLSEGKTCPHDNTNITLADIFPDTIANREILQLRVECPHCGLVCTLAESQSHLTSCQLRPSLEPGVTESLSCPECGDLLPLLPLHHQELHLVCPNALVACSFAHLGCSEKMSRRESPAHMERSSGLHLGLLAEQVTKVKQILQAERVVARDYEDGSAPPPHHAQSRLIKSADSSFLLSEKPDGLLVLGNFSRE